MEQIQATATVTQLVGKAFVLHANGEKVALQQGDTLLPGTIIMTESGSNVVVQGSDFTLELNEDSLTEIPKESLENAQAPQILDTASDEVAALQAAILDGQDPTQAFEATAAGAPDAGANPGGPNDGSGNGGFVQILRTGNERIAEAGFDTSVAFPTLENTDFFNALDQTILVGDVTSPTQPLEIIPTLGINDVLVGEGNEAVFIVILSNSVTTTSNVTFTLTPGSASFADLWADGVPWQVTVNGATVNVNADGTFVAAVPAGTTSLNVGVPTFNDNVFEGEESFTLTGVLSGTVNGVGFNGITATGNGVIVDDGRELPVDPTDPEGPTTPADDDRPTLAINNVTVSEGDEAVFTVTLSNPVDSDSELTFTLEPGTAGFDDLWAGNEPREVTVTIDGVEQTATVDAQGNFSVTVPAGSTSLTVGVPTFDDNVFEGKEGFTLKGDLSGTVNGVGFSGITATGNGLIVDDGTGPGPDPDNDTPVIQISNAGTVNEGGDAVFDITLTHEVDAETTITLDLTHGDTNGADFALVDGKPTVTINNAAVTVTANGDGTFSFTVPANTANGIQVTLPTTDDSVFEGSEDFELAATLTGSTANGTDLPAGITATGNGIITDATGEGNDVPTLTVADAGTVIEGSTASFAVSLDKAVDNDTTLTFQLSGQATAADVGTPSVTLNGVAVTVTAVAGGGFSVNVPAGTTSGLVVSVPTLNDTVFEGAESLVLTGTLSGSTASGTVLPSTITDSGNGIITDATGEGNDVPTLTVADAGTV
ncbi:retention module-containing protein, partial [Oceanisphaera sp. W20_SRM_FM3]|uniref:retention module-containing protein n=1 Tax=Oceanisphaera sp. W20_SRM_FM3 TaxID=3240267 RepID=UPI003F97E5B2